LDETVKGLNFSAKHGIPIVLNFASNKTLRTMKTSLTSTAKESTSLHGINFFQSGTGRTYLFSLTTDENQAHDYRKKDFRKENLIKPEIVYQMASGQVPDLWAVCHEFANETYHSKTPRSAIQFIPVLHRLKAPETEEVKRFLKNPETRHVLVSNDLLEVVLIHWKPGRASDIHGHPGGGGVFKLLKGKLEEVRYTPEKSPRLLSTNSLRSGSITYIDDSMAYHQVGNPYGSSAISLHVYLK
jgi:hypothetical protein